MKHKHIFKVLDTVRKEFGWTIYMTCECGEVKEKFVWK